jgi:mono/diheme cytochrome c family protein
LPAAAIRGRLIATAGGISMLRLCLIALVALACLASPAAADEQAERGKYLVTIAGCSDCHTPGGLLGHPDFKSMLGGSDAGFGVPGTGVFLGPNLTPDKETGLGGWTSGQIIAAFTTGKRPDGRVLSGVMPWPAFSQLTSADAQAIAAYLQSLPAVKNKVPGPFGPKDKPSVPVFAVMSGEIYSALPAP